MRLLRFAASLVNTALEALGTRMNDAMLRARDEFNAITQEMDARSTRDRR